MVTREDIIAAIREERERQISAEGYTLDHDADHDEGELGMAAGVYAAPTPIHVEIGQHQVGGHTILLYDEAWPWQIENTSAVRSMDDVRSFRTPSCNEIKEGKDRTRQLIVAGALILAELERVIAQEDKQAEEIVA